MTKTPKPEDFMPAKLPKRITQRLAGADWENRNVLVGCLRVRQGDVCVLQGSALTPSCRAEDYKTMPNTVFRDVLSKLDPII